MLKKWERKEILLLLILIALCLDIIMRLPLAQCIADTFRIDECITLGVKDKPSSYLHVVPHGPEE